MAPAFSPEFPSDELPIIDPHPIPPAKEANPEPPVEEPKPPVEEPKPPVEEPKPPVEEPAPLKAQAEDFAEQPSDVLLTYSGAVSPSAASSCVGLEASGESVDFAGIEQGPTAQTIRLELVPEGTLPKDVQCPATQDARSVDTLTVAPAAPAPGGVVSDPIDPKYLTELPFGDRSFWIQPWRAYLDTLPASRLLDSLGINYNVHANEAEGVAQLLQDSGFKYARTEISWNSLSYENPTQFVNKAQVDGELEALHKHDLRPLILLNSDSGGPAPAKAVNLETVAEAPAGARTVTLTPASAAQVVPGKTGFDNLSFGGDPDTLITSVSDSGVATLSAPLEAALSAGTHKGATLLYAPFGSPELANGEPNPAFQATLNGWLSYVATVCKEATSVFGPGGYDLEVWNELSFGSQFLEETNYYSPAREEGKGSVTEALLDATVAYIRDPANGISPQVGISDGFASQTPFASAESVPPGTTALSKHLYAGRRDFPEEDEVNGVMPINALGNPDVEQVHGSASPPYKPLFVPNYHAYFPEYYLSAIQTETAIRDLSPFTTTIYGVPHGRSASESNGQVPEIWMTEYNLSPLEAIVIGPHGTDLEPELTPADERHFMTKALLRHLVSMVSKGLARDYFFTASGAARQGLDLVESSFLSALNKEPSVYPGDEAGGETTTAFRRMLAQFQGPGPTGEPRQLKLLSIAQEGNHAQFAGDGTAAHPNLYDREVLGVFPFQSSPTRFVIPIYVITQDLATLYDPSAPTTDVDRYDLPNENFRITLGNLPETATPPAVSAYDPIRGESTPARLVSRQGSKAIFEIAATDYPRLLTIDYTGK